MLCGSCKHHGDKYVAYAAVTATKIALETDQMLENQNQITATSAHSPSGKRVIKSQNRIEYERGDKKAKLNDRRENRDSNSNTNMKNKQTNKTGCQMHRNTLPQ